MTDTFGDRVRDLRQRKCWTQVMLAIKADLSPSAVSDVERRNRPPNGEVVIALAKALGVSTDTLLGVKAK